MSDFVIQIKDFQSLSKVDLVIEDGLNIVVGKTNAGKSAVLRAINCAIFNIGNDEMVKAGKRYAGVMIDNGEHKFFWKRDSHGKNEKTTYQIDSGDPIKKVGRNQLEEIENLFNIKDVRLANGLKERINFWYQGDAPFLTNKTGGQLFEFLSQSSCEKYMKVTKKLYEDMRSLRVKIEGINSTIDALKSINNEKKEFLDKNEGYDGLYRDIVILNDEVGRFNVLEEVIERYNSLKVKIDFKGKDLERIYVRLGYIDFDDVCDKYNSFIGLVSEVEGIEELLNSIKKKERSLGDVRGRLDKVERELYPKKSGLVDVEGEYVDLLEVESDLGKIKSILIELKGKKEKRNEIRSNLSVVESRIGIVDLGVLESDIIDLEKSMDSIRDIKSLIDSYLEKKDKLSYRSKNYGDVCRSYDESFREFEDFKSSIGCCPYCNHSLNSESE